MHESADKLLPLTVVVLATLAVLIPTVVGLVRSGRVPMLGGDGRAAGRSPKA